MLCSQMGLYEEILVPSSEAPIDAGQLALTPKEYQQAPSPNTNGETAVLRSQLAREDDTHQYSREKQQKVVEPQTAPPVLERSTSIAGEDAFRGPLPEWRPVRLDAIDLHPSLQSLYQKKGFVFPPMPPSRYLAPHGILSCAAHVPIHLLIEGPRLLCFAGVRLYLAALSSFAPSAWVGALVYAAVTDDEMSEAIEINERIFPIWFRETRAQREANELRHLDGEGPHGLTYHDQDQQQLSELFRTCTRTVQTRMALRRKAPKS